MQSNNKQTAINLISSFIAFFANLGINFFLTPFVVKKLGIEAYGFLGLSSNIIGYTSIITIALNAMAGRFITIKYQEGSIDDANKYFSSVFFSNLILSIIVILALIICLYNLEILFNIPSYLLFDVKALFALSILSTVAGLLTNVYGIATFIKNRLELSSIRKIFGNILNACSLIILFGFFPAHLWYYGVTGLLMTLYFFVTNLGFTRKLTPEFHLNIKNFEWMKVKELLSAGVWGLINRLNNILQHGLDLVIANIFIGPIFMGIFSMSRSVPTKILALFGSMSGSFLPLLTKLWAQKKKNEFKNEYLKSIRICGFFSTIPLSCLYIYGDAFYSLWLPDQDSTLLQYLTVVGTIGMVFAMPLEPLWGIFTITNKLKYSTLTLLANSILVFLTVIISMIFVKDNITKLFILAGAGSFWGTIRTLFFLPIYGAFCVNEKWNAFYPPIYKSFLSMMIILTIGFSIKIMFTLDTWFSLIFAGLMQILICIIVNSFVILQKKDRQYLVNRLYNKLNI